MRTREWMPVAPAVLLRVLLALLLVTVAVHDPLDAARRDGPQKDVAAQPQEAEKPKGVPVVFDGKEIAHIYISIKGYTAEDRAKAVGERLVRFAEDHSFDPASIIIEESDTSSDILSA